MQHVVGILLGSRILLDGKRLWAVSAHFIADMAAGHQHAVIAKRECKAARRRRPTGRYGDTLCLDAISREADAGP
jgi:hypothetical protein